MTVFVSTKVLELPRASKRAVAMVIDLLLCVVTVAFSYALRLDYWAPPVGTQWLSYLAAIVFAIPLFVSFGFYRAIFRFVGWGALVTVVRACFVYGAIYSLLFTVVGVVGVPRTVGVLQPILLFIAVGASRAIARAWLGGGYRAILAMNERRRVFIYGAGSAGRQLAAGLSNSHEMYVVGFVDDDPVLHGQVLNGKTIYPPTNLPELIERLAISDLLLAMPSASRRRRSEVVDNLRGTSAVIRTLPGLADLAHGRVSISDLKELDIEDLLGRDPVAPNADLLAKCITGKRVMVTGAGGSIGSELCRQILELKPACLLLFDLSEFALYAVQMDLLRRPISRSVEIVALLGSVQDARRINDILAQYRPETIYHAAAYKHVPLVEENAAEAFRNNVVGTRVVAEAAVAQKVTDLVLISTDKAVRPTNVMGATKRVAEQVLQALALEHPGSRLSMVRFGNVLGSSGSVVPLFRQQISAGGPVTVTHDEITRYFMTIPEAAQLVIQAGAMAEGGEVFLLDMGSPVKIKTLARRMIELSGFTVRDENNEEGDIAIEVVGLRPGEKLYEELLIGDNPSPTSHPRIMKGSEGFMPWPVLKDALNRMEQSLYDATDEQLRAQLTTLVPEFRPSETKTDGSILNVADVAAA